MLTIATQKTGRTIFAAIGAVVATFICIAAAAGPAKAATVNDLPRQVSISVKGLDLMTDEGQATLQGRLRAAARSVCDTGAGTVQARTEEARCVRNAIKAARQQSLRG